MRLNTTKAIITGGASGLGEATARYLTSQGAKVTILDINAERGAIVSEEIGCFFVNTNVSDELSA